MAYREYKTSSKGRKNNSIVIYHSDFETLITEPTQVWLWDICDQEDNHYNGSTIEQWLQKVVELKCQRVDFKNLDFDGEFIINYLMENGYVLGTEFKSKVPKTFYVNKFNRQMYSMSITHETGHRVTIYDSQKYIIGSLAKWGKALGLPKGNTPLMVKVDKYRNVWDTDGNMYKWNHKEFIDYVQQDTRIALKTQQRMSKMGINKTTIASSAMHFWQGLEKDRHNDFRLKYQHLSRAVRGGLCICNPVYQLKELDNVNVYDVTSLYPSVMYNNTYPVDQAFYYDHMILESQENDKPTTVEQLLSGYPFKRPPHEFFKVHNIYIEYSVKEGQLPFILTNKGYVMEFKGEMCIVDSDLEILLQTCNIKELAWFQSYHFKLEPTPFKRYIDEWFAIKDICSQTNDELGRGVAKLMLNSLWGKFGTLDDGKEYTPIYEPNMPLQWNLKHVKKDTKSLFYMPIALRTLSLARRVTYEAIQKVGVENFVYCDTDSIFTFKKLPSDLCGTGLGQWNLEKNNAKCLIYCQKRYKLGYDGNVKVACAGIPQEIFDGMKFSDVDLDNVTFDVMQMKPCVGGKIMKKITKVLKNNIQIKGNV